MYFSKFLVATIATLFTSSYAQMSATQVVSNINIITAQSQALQAPANSINILSGALFVIGQGPFPQIVVGFNSIISIVTQDITAMGGTPPFTVAADETAILNAFISFVKVHQALLNIIIGKAGILNSLPLVGPPVAAVLRTLEGVVDDIVLGLIALAPDVQAEITAQASALDVTLKQAIAAYS